MFYLLLIKPFQNLLLVDFEPSNMLLDYLYLGNVDVS